MKVILMVVYFNLTFSVSNFCSRVEVFIPSTTFTNMDLLTFLRVIVLVTNGIYCFVPGGVMESSPSKTITLPIQQQANDISTVYDPGVGE